MILLKSVSLFLFVIFSILGGFHFYWLFGGIWGLKKVIPTKTKNATRLEIPRIATLFVAIILSSMGIFYLMHADFIVIDLPNFLMTFCVWAIPIVFALRAIGEFRFVGYFKRIRDTDFAKADTQLFTPLCTLISVLGFWIIYLQSS